MRVTSVKLQVDLAMHRAPFVEVGLAVRDDSAGVEPTGSRSAAASLARVSDWFNALPISLLQPLDRAL
jgi:hypothetical protein